MIFCNAGPIAASSYLAKETVASAHEAFIKAVGDLIKLGQSIIIDLGFVKVKIIEKNLSYGYRPDFITGLNHTSFENKMKKAEKTTADHWKNSLKEKWMNSTLSTLLK